MKLYYKKESYICATIKGKAGVDFGGCDINYFRTRATEKHFHYCSDYNLNISEIIYFDNVPSWCHFTQKTWIYLVDYEPFMHKEPERDQLDCGHIGFLCQICNRDQNIFRTVSSLNDVVKLAPICSGFDVCGRIKLQSILL